MRDYSLNAEQAVAGSTEGFQRITQSGAYTGVFTKAKYITATTGAEGIEFTFRAVTGAEANYLSLYTHNAAGGETYGYSQLNALMACLKLRHIKAESIQVMEYDHDMKREQTVMVEGYPQLMNVPVGVVLQREEYRKRDGSVGESMSLHAFFNPDTRQTGGEIVQQQPAGTIDSVVRSLKDKTLSGANSAPVPATNIPSTPTGQAMQAQQEAQAAALDSFSDDIPF